MTTKDWMVNVLGNFPGRVKKLAEEPAIIRAIVNDLQRVWTIPWPQKKSVASKYWGQQLRFDVSLAIKHHDLGEEWLSYVEQHLQEEKP